MTKDFLFPSRFVELFSCSAAEQLFPSTPRPVLSRPNHHHHRCRGCSIVPSSLFPLSLGTEPRKTGDFLREASGWGSVMVILLGSPVPSITRVSRLRRHPDYCSAIPVRKWNTFAECYPPPCWGGLASFSASLLLDPSLTSSSAAAQPSTTTTDRGASISSRRPRTPRALNLTWLYED